MALLKVDNETATLFREAVRSHYGKDAWGKIQHEVKIALTNRANILKKEI